MSPCLTISVLLSKRDANISYRGSTQPQTHVAGLRLGREGRPRPAWSELWEQGAMKAPSVAEPGSRPSITFHSLSFSLSFLIFSLSPVSPALDLMPGLTFQALSWDSGGSGQGARLASDWPTRGSPAT